MENPKQPTNPDDDDVASFERMTFAHLNTPVMREGIRRWQEKRRAEEAAKSYAEAIGGINEPVH